MTPPPSYNTEAGVDGQRLEQRLEREKLLGWPRRCKLAQAFWWKCSYKGLESALLLGQLGVCLTLAMVPAAAARITTATSPIWQPRILPGRGPWAVIREIYRVTWPKIYKLALNFE